MKQKMMVLLAVFMLGIGMAGCTDSPEPADPADTVVESETVCIPDVSYTTKPVTYAEPGGSVFGMKTYMDTATVGSVTYAFEGSISQADRAACMKQTALWLERLGAEKELCIYVYNESTYDSDLITDGSVYTHVQDWQGTAYGVSLIRGLYGAYCNYGMAYGYANHLRGESDTPAPEFPADFAYYDLNDLCFHPDFVSAEEIAVVGNIANAFVKEYIAVNGVAKFQKILSWSGSVSECGKANEALTEFYGSKGVQTHLSEVLYSFGGHSFDYTAACAYATFYVEDDWTDTANATYPEFVVYDGYLNRDYAKTKAYFETNVAQMKQYQELFARGEYDHSLEITFSNDLVFSDVSCYLHGVHRIHLVSTVSLMHEYIHSLTVAGNIGEKWAVEGLATYYSTVYNAYAIPYWTYDYRTCQVGYMQQYREKMGMDIDFVRERGIMDHVMVYCLDMYDPNASYGAGSSFLYYLVTRFGERPVLDYILKNHDLSTLTEQSFDELIAEWREYMEATYSDYEKYPK